MIIFPAAETPRLAAIHHGSAEFSTCQVLAGSGAPHCAPWVPHAWRLESGQGISLRSPGVPQMEGAQLELFVVSKGPFPPIDPPGGVVISAICVFLS